MLKYKYYFEQKEEEIVRLFTGFLTIIVLLVCFSLAVVYASSEVKQVESIEKVIHERVIVDDIHVATNSYMYDQKGNLISEIYQEENRIILPYEKIPQTVIHAFLAIEDQRFFDHKGYDVPAIIRALIANAKSNSIQQGASTITQQVVKNLFLTNEQTYDRKLTEVLYAYKLEETYPKEKIFELYFNTIYFQNGVYGFETASQYYFQKPSHELTLAEVAFLAAIPNNPYYYDPIKRSENTHERKQLILSEMLEANFITEEQYEEAIHEKIVLNVKKKVDLFPDYVTYIHHEFKELIAQNEGFKERLQEATTEEEIEAIHAELDMKVQQLYEQGIHIETNLNQTMQKIATQAVETNLPYGDIQGAAVVIDHTTNAIIAITGGKHYKKFDFHRGFQAYRQPGSAIKPLLVYGPYLSEYEMSIQNYVNANNFCKNGYCPRNYGGGQYGNVTIEQAFIRSYNTPAVRLLDQVGIETAFSYLQKFQFSQLQKEDYTLPAALGGFTVGMTPLEMTNAFTTFANNGVFIPAKGIQTVKDRDGNILYEWKQEATPVWNETTNERMRTLLNRAVTSGTGRRAYVPGNYVGGKTGTTDQYKDIWFIGIHNELTAGVWVGKDDPASLLSIYHSSPQQKIWRDIMRNR